MMTRRSFLAAVGVIPPAMALLAPEMVRRTFFLPPAGGWLENWMDAHHRAHALAMSMLQTKEMIAIEFYRRYAVCPTEWRAIYGTSG